MHVELVMPDNFILQKQVLIEGFYFNTTGYV
jgi:hypothetical protein